MRLLQQVVLARTQIKRARRQCLITSRAQDIGANVGCFSLALAALGYQIIAFEGMQRNQQALYSSLCANPALMDRFTLFPLALGSSVRHCAVLSDGVNVNDGHVACTDNLRAQLQAAGYEVRSEVDVVRLDDFMDGIHVDVVKMDVEGMEPQVVAGGRAIPFKVLPRGVSAPWHRPAARAANSVASLSITSVWQRCLLHSLRPLHSLSCDLFCRAILSD